MRTMEFGNKTFCYYEESDLADCRVCHVKPTYKDGTSSSGGAYVRCPKCGIKIWKAVGA